jgi:predicted transglutaminase-like cysteine proteinase
MIVPFGGLVMLKRRLPLVLGLGALLVLQNGISLTSTRAAESASSITEASPTLAPFQHVRFCLKYPQECAPQPTKADRITLSQANADLLKHVNQNVNGAILPITKQYGKNLADSWEIAPSSGDCNDYAVTKRHLLLSEGFPASALRLSVVRTNLGLGHLVLIVGTSKGDLVLDNMTDAIQPWQKTPYHWLKIQSKSDARFWNDIKPPMIVQSSLSAELRLDGR